MSTKSILECIFINSLIDMYYIRSKGLLILIGVFLLQDGTIQPLSGSVTPSAFFGTIRAGSTESGEVAGYTYGSLGSQGQAGSATGQDAYYQQQPAYNTSNVADPNQTWAQGAGQTYDAANYSYQQQYNQQGHQQQEYPGQVNADQQQTQQQDTSTYNSGGMHVAS